LGDQLRHTREPEELREEGGTGLWVEDLSPNWVGGKKIEPFQAENGRA